VGNKPGTVGQPLPGGSFREVDPESLDPLATGEDGLILFGGAQVMIGYLKNQAMTDAVIFEQDGVRWYKTGDKGHLDEDGFLTIVEPDFRYAEALMPGGVYDRGEFDVTRNTAVEACHSILKAVNGTSLSHSCLPCLGIPAGHFGSQGDMSKHRVII
jgi:acyl-[acyl-carrier-protein]-phospholipid O-acyltransferase/long-chain-fatty-acid--[acyl-carrier-protein] ligase